MSSEQEILEKIECYTRGKLSPEDKVAFEAELEIDEALRRRVQASLIVEQIVIGHEALKLKEQMRRDMAPPKPKWPLYLFVAFLVLVACGVLYIAQSKDVLKKDETPNTQGASPQKGGVRKIRPVIVLDTVKPTLSKSDREKVVLSNKGQDPTFSQSEVVSYSQAVASPFESEPAQYVISYERKQSSHLSMAQTEDLQSPCHNLFGEVDFYTIPTCVGSENGELHIHPQSVKGGTPPFVFMIGEKASTSTFDHLSSGSYRLTIKDANNCTVQSAKEVVIQTKNCQEKKEYTFNPDFDLAWQIPYDKHKEPKSFQVMDKGGKVFFQTQVEGFYPSEWNGQSSYGQSLGLGLHFFTIEYSDGTVDEGSIVVTR